MKPFRFFFGLSLAVILFSFFARFIILAMMAAAIMSIVFHIGRKVKNFFQNLQWENDDYYRGEFRNEYEVSPHFAKRGEELFYDFPKKRADFLTDYRSIRVQ